MPEITKKKPMIDPERVAKYKKTIVTGPDGKKRRVVDNNDKVAVMLRGKTQDELYDILDKHGMAKRIDEWKSRGLNAGQVAMNARNALRHKLATDAAPKAA